MTAAIRLRVWLTRRALDRRLASGADPTATSALQLRAEQLTAPGSRRALADEADAIRRSGVAPDARGELETVVRRLRSAEPIAPAGAARAHLLLQPSDRATAEPTWEQIWDVTDALNDHAR